MNALIKSGVVKKETPIKPIDKIIEKVLRHKFEREKATVVGTILEYKDALRQTSNNIFSMYVDEFMAEEEAYNFFYELSKETGRIIDDSLVNFIFFSGNYHHASSVLANKNNEEVKVADRDIFINDVASGYFKVKKVLLETMRNRKARESFGTTFIDMLSGLEKEILEMRPSIRSCQRLSSIKENLEFISKEYDHYIRTFDRRISSKKAKESGNSRTFDTAPFKDMFHTAVSADEIKPEFKARLEEIVSGVREDIRDGNDKGAFLIKRNYSDSWQFSLGGFSKEKAEQLSEFLGITGLLETNPGAVEKAYRNYVKAHHTDVSDSDSVKVAEASVLMREYRTYIKTTEK